MTLTTIVYSSTNTEQYRELWTQMLLAEAEEKIFWNPFSGFEGTANPIIVRTDLLAGAGGKVKIDLASAMTGAGVSGETKMTDAEEALSFYQATVTVDLVRNAAASHKLSQQYTVHSLRETARRKSANWLAGKIDDAIFDILDAQAVNIVYGGDATSKATLETNDVMTVALIDKAATMARDKLIQPCGIAGQYDYLMVVSNHQAYQLRQDPAWIAANGYAQLRGDGNPIFTGAIGAWNGVLVKVNNRVARGSNAGTDPATVNYAIAHLVGSNAVGFGWAQYPQMIEEVRDYGAVYGVGADAIYGAVAGVFNSKAIGHVPVMTATVDPNG